MTHTRALALPEPLHLRADENMVEGIVVPFGQVADVAEIVNGELRRYKEGFRAGSCERMVQGARARGNAGFIKLTLDHDDALDKRVGSGVLIEERSEGAFMQFKLHRRAELDLIKSLIEDSHDGFSIEFSDVADPDEVDGVTWRRQIHMQAVSLTPVPVYAGAKVLALRDDDELLSLPTPELDETLAWLEAEKAKV